MKIGEEKWLKQLFRGNIFYAPSQTRSKGVMLGIAENLPWELKVARINEAGRYVILKGIWAKREMMLMGVYAPHTHNARFGEELFTKILQVGAAEMILLGDFNAMVSNLEDRSTNSKSSELPNVFKEYMELFELVDVWRAQNPNKQYYTYFSKFHLSHSRIDYIMSSIEIDAEVKVAKIGELLLSDHAFVSI